MSGGNYTTFNVVAGLTYTWSTCGDTDFDTELTLFQGTGCSGTELAYNDNFCGDQSQITWTATFTGVVTILLTEMDYILWVIPDPCQTNSDQMTLSVSCSDMPVGCSDAAPFCTGTTYNFPLMVGSTAESGPDYACLVSQPDPVWYYLLVDNPGDIIIYMQSPTGNDIDFICWGPFTSATGSCTAGMTSNCTSCPNNTTSPSFYPSGNTVDCSFDAASYETCHILGALSGQYYMLCITNYSQAAGTITFTQTGGTGTTNCNIVFCDMTNLSGLASACDPATNDYSVDGVIVFNDQPSTGQLIVTDNSGNSQTFNPPFVSPLSYTLSGINSDGATHTITAYFTDAPTCQLTLDYTAPVSCNNCSVDAGPDQSLCGLTATMGAITQVGDINTSWSSTNPGVVFTDASDANSDVTVPLAGTYTFTWTITNSLGLTCSDDVIVTFNDLPSVSATASPSTICINSSSDISASGADTYLWDNGLGNGNTFNVTPLSTTTYTVTGTSTATSCSNTANVTVTVNTNLVVNISPASPMVCDGDDIILTASTTGSGVDYEWSTGDLTATITQTPLTTTNYTVSGTDATGCTGSASTTVTVSPIPDVSFSGNPLAGCVPVTVQFQGISTASISSWDWQFGDGQTSTSQNPNHTYLTSGLYNVTLGVTSNDGCPNSVTINNYIDVASYPDASFVANPTIAGEDNPYIQFIDQSSGANTWWWDFGEPGTGDNSSMQNPSYTYQSTGTFTVTLIVKNSNGCTDSTSATVQIKPTFTFYLPNSFSPNRDELNDMFIPFGIGWDVNTFQMRIYDRWGKLVFITHDVNKGWDGNMPDGSEAIPGVYAVRVWVNASDGTKNYFYDTVVLIHQGNIYFLIGP